MGAKRLVQEDVEAVVLVIVVVSALAHVLVVVVMDVLEAVQVGLYFPHIKMKA